MRADVEPAESLELAEHGGPDGVRDAAQPVRMDFSTCVNAYGPAPAVAEAVRRAPIDAYPDPRALAPREAAAAYWDVAVDRVSFGAGAAELIAAAACALLRANDVALVAAPAFGEYARAAALCGARVTEIRGADPFAPEADEVVDAIRRVRPRVVFLAAPSSPAGRAYTADALARVADACADAGARLVLDQSYDAFLSAPLGTPTLGDHPAVLVIRSLTKDHALAGLRAGFAIGPAPLIERLERVRTPWSASTPAQAAAGAALSAAGDAHLAATLPRLRAERMRIAATLDAAGIATVPSDTHYLLADVGDGRTWTSALRRTGIAVRPCASFGLPRHVRIAARTPAENDALLAALPPVLQPRSAP
ncbi:histidinol-phosphate transaminase [Longimicrobium sp.]|uniref:pyridoxal phosphate-dependent aminotransferase n=1 Tax=Longimicrobium sp. TaxID=2029185 RepID=UPI002E2ED75D|nr:histidinol-phosphate transaminase [Longimicrobium sp.]HEX6037565.1 histidinol-phosphate transaminase [Longimicrobium sp.]